MLRVGRLRTRSCGGRGRRELVQAGAAAALGLSLPELLWSNAASRGTKGKARSVLLLWLWGGPSHLDTFDMKPQAPIEYRGPYVPIATRVPGIEISELLPRLARHSDKFSLIRSLHHDSSDHGIGGTIGLTGSNAGAISLGGQVMPGQVQPALGSVVTRVHGLGRDLPGFVAIGGHLHQGKRSISGEGGGIVGRLHDPFRLDYEPGIGVNIPQVDLLDGVTPSGLSARRALLDSVDQLRRRLENSSALADLDRFYQRAFSLLSSGKTREVFDLEREPAELRTRYGHFRFGQCCLLARRLVEAGVSVVQVNWSSHVEPIEDTGDGGWDTHDRNFPQLQDRHTWMLDQSLAALLEDLQSRGLLEETLVLAVGEFGRTPKINAKAGRDHWQQCYSALIAGGGIRAGRVVGASDRRGEHPVSRPLHPADLQATVLAALGIGSFGITGAGLTPRGEPIEELL